MDKRALQVFRLCWAGAGLAGRFVLRLDPATCLPGLKTLMLKTCRPRGVHLQSDGSASDDPEHRRYLRPTCDEALSQTSSILWPLQGPGDSDDDDAAKGAETILNAFCEKDRGSRIAEQRAAPLVSVPTSG